MVKVTIETDLPATDTDNSNLFLVKRRESRRTALFLYLKFIVSHLVKESSTFVEADGPLTYIQEPFIGHCPESSESSLYPRYCELRVEFYLI
jgi:hypothetical protein